MTEIDTTDLDRIIQALYTAAIEDDWLTFRPHALAILCQWAGAGSGAWHTHSSSALPGEFTEYPQGTGLNREQLMALPFRLDKREIHLKPLPPALQPSGSADDDGYAVRYAHRGGGDLSSSVLLRLPVKGAVRPLQEIRRAIGHMIEADTLALRHFIQRDEWLYSLGRPNRGCAALIDSHGAIYVASRRFRELLAETFGTGTFTVLPCPIPESALDSDGDFSHQDLHFRLSRQEALYVIYARRLTALDQLSPREQEIARALSTGKTFKSVARQFNIAISTVANHASRIYKKLGIYRREELTDLTRTSAQVNPGETDKRP
ncbi:MAG TPA: LuxR C-terminal-related transcriptional regulator [Stenotrophobium sp.]|nr:LuxR C-terminal-related transcriptional regulator [Stenotrophobium sp.]